MWYLRYKLIFYARHIVCVKVEDNLSKNGSDYVKNHMGFKGLILL